MDNTKLEQEFRKYGLHLPSILLPANHLDYKKFSVIACDQFSEQPEYWRECRRQIGQSPSAINLILPEAELWQEDSAQQLICKNMDSYLTRHLFKALPPGWIYVRRHTSSGIRHGLIVGIDLEAYDYAPKSRALIRATEATVMQRLPARVNIRRQAAIELPHVLVLINDQENKIVQLLNSYINTFKPLYNFNLMQGGGHIQGFALIKNEVYCQLLHIFRQLYTKKGDGALFWVGDGNHSLAAAKQCWEEIKPTLTTEQIKNHPMRFALVELVNIFDQGIKFYPIHRLLMNVDPDKVQAELKFNAKCPPPLQKLQPKLDRWLAQHPSAGIEYVHDKKECLRLGEQPHNLAIVYEEFTPKMFFDTVQSGEMFVKKSFSIGLAKDKRYYLEARKIK